jgi:nitroreductase
LYVPKGSALQVRDRTYDDFSCADGLISVHVAPYATVVHSTDARTLRCLLLRRHSCRAFRPDPVPASVIHEIVEMAQRTASWCNAQPWHVIVTSGEGTERFRAALREQVVARQQPARPDLEFPREYVGVYRERRSATAVQLYENLGILEAPPAARRAQALENYNLFGAPHVAIVTTAETLGVYGAVDCGGFVATFMLAAQSLGVATIAQASLVAHGDFVRSHFSVPADRHLVCGIAFGLEDPGHRANGFRTPRASVHDVLSWVE